MEEQGELFVTCNQLQKVRTQESGLVAALTYFLLYFCLVKTTPWLGLIA